MCCFSATSDSLDSNNTPLLKRLYNLRNHLKWWNLSVKYLIPMVRGLKIYEHTVGLDIWTFCFLQNITTSKNNQNFPESKMRSDTTLLQFLLSDRKNKLIETQVRVCVVKGYSFYRLLEQICFQTFSEDNPLFRPKGRQSLSNIQSLLRAEREEIRRKQIERERERERERGRQEGVRAN